MIVKEYYNTKELLKFLDEYKDFNMIISFRLKLNKYIDDILNIYNKLKKNKKNIISNYEVTGLRISVKVNLSTLNKKDYLDVLNEIIYPKQLNNSKYFIDNSKITFPDNIKIDVLDSDSLGFTQFRVEKNECPEDKILNPKSGKCVKKSGKIGKEILGINKECPKDKILNPKTKRCVSKTGKIGKELLKK